MRLNQDKTYAGAVDGLGEIKPCHEWLIRLFDPPHGATPVGATGHVVPFEMH